MKDEGRKSAIARWLANEVAFFEKPLTLWSRLAILVGVAALIPALILPLWSMSFRSNQYPDGLNLYIYAHQLEGGKTAFRDDLREINSLNHYIGMRPLLESDFGEFSWLPFAIGALGLLALRAAVLGKMGSLVDVFVLFVYFGGFSFWSFYHKLHLYGHTLDPTAAIKVAPFTPPLIGTQVVGNFTVNSYPEGASFSLVAFAILLALAIVLSWRHREEVV